MGGKSGGGADAGPMLEYGTKALDLQKQIYQENKQMAQPWYQTGVSAQSRLATLMGLPGAGNQTREQIYQSMLPQYTSQTAAKNMGAVPQGATLLKSGLGGLAGLGVFDLAGRPKKMGDIYQMGSQFFTTDPTTGLTYTVNTKGMGGSGDSRGNRPSWYLYGGGQTQPQNQVDYAGLNAAVDRALAQQQKPSGFGDLLKTFDASQMYNDPGYQFRLGEGIKARERQLAAMGKYLSPEASKVLERYGQEYASGEYGNAYNRFNTDQGNLFNRLAALSGYGQTASGQVIGSGANYANAATDLYTGMGNSIVAANQANAARRGSMFGNILGLAGNIGAAYLTGGASAAGGGFVSDRRLKIDIEPIGNENGHNVYKFKYRDDPEGKTYIGVMADEVIKTNPDAIIMQDNYMTVDYDKIGVKFREAE